jgi:hypothetical protein
MENGTMKNVYAPTTEFSYATIRSDTSSMKRNVNDNVMMATESVASFIKKNGIDMSVVMSLTVSVLLLLL